MKADLARLPQAAKAYIHELEAGLAERDARIYELSRRLDALEEQYRLALARQYAPKSEKQGSCVQRGRAGCRRRACRRGRQ
jgi:hypothetical protein